MRLGAAGSPSAPVPYFEQPAPIAIVLGAFFLLFLPLALLALIPNFFGFVPYLFLIEVVGLGTSHFFITLAVYLQADNRAYFVSSARNRLIYVAAPLVILASFGLSAATDFRIRHPEAAAYVFSGVRIFDFFHVGRQSAGMLQIWKRPFAGALPSWLRRAENAFFVGMALLQWETFLLGGHFLGDHLYASVPAFALVVLGLAIAMSHARCISWRAPFAFAPLAYFSLQAICAAAAVLETRLYLVALAMHYVEYHVIMKPRCVDAPLDRVPSLDRATSWLRGRPGLFYVALAAIVIAFELRSYVATDASQATTFFVHVFDGIFLLHYFLDAFLWKFSDPFYQKTLAPLYFAKGRQRARVARPRVFQRWGMAAALTAGSVGALAIGPRSIGVIAKGFEQRAIDPLIADSHLRWGVELAKRGELGAAHRHLREALRKGPNDPRTAAALQWVKSHRPERPNAARSPAPLAYSPASTP